jgi:hypothetical protein
VNGDIVIGIVKYRRIQGVWTMTPSGTGGMFHIHPRRRELLDEIERLRAALAAIQNDANIIGDSDNAQIYIDLLNDIWKMAHDALPVVGGPS